jgi:5-methyltetrahydrofolate--homocysteine methyltransferase
MAAEIRDWAQGLRQHRRRLLRHLARHIRAIAAGCRGSPRARRRRSRRSCASPASKPSTSAPTALFVNVGERTNVTGSKAFARMILEGRFDDALAVARQQVENGAQVIDINMDEAMLDSVAAMVALPQADRLRAGHLARALMLDSLEVGSHRGRPQVHPGQGRRQFDLDEGRRGQVPRTGRLARRYGAAVIVMAFDEQGQADTFARKTASAASAPTSCWCRRIGFPAEDIIFDPNIFAIATGIPSTTTTPSISSNAVRWIKQNLPHARSSGGVSNVSFSFRGNDAVREAIHTVFLYHAIKAG